MPHRGYTVRRAREGWGVYVVGTGEPVRVDGREQTGLSSESAIELLAALRVLAFIRSEFGE
ncbi:hypothetical protein [Methylobacterium nodulans]|uniref:Uncharacterized protein n=1 Tax=Methylobacterium nodulans (strain LMG 21967 / CNCM I-2342 / ORS 2060) TaxID=460265 RepID=B8ICN5_METNO|nr:hypothetical protein [Methylobacterium nodulans]ACL57446.1 conserved hypothetical protein [Methylobacterium nodulans ORS 2060]